MTTLSQFVATWTDKGVDWNNQAQREGYQCVLLAEEYNHEVVGAPPLGGNAIDVWTHYPTNFYTRIARTPQNHPEPADIVIWDGPNAIVGTTQYGHIGVCVSATAGEFTSFDQNWPDGSLAHLQTHGYTAVVGWLHPLTAATSPAPMPIDEAAGNKIRHVQALTLNVPRVQYHERWAEIAAWVTANK